VAVEDSSTGAVQKQWMLEQGQAVSSIINSGLELMPTRASQVSQSLQDLFRPAAVEDLLDGAELEQRLQDEGRLEGILTDPELMPNWEVQLQMQQAA